MVMQGCTIVSNKTYPTEEGGVESSGSLQSLKPAALNKGLKTRLKRELWYCIFKICDQSMSHTFH